VGGIELTTLDASPLLDVLHYFFELDNHMSTSEEAEARSALRTAVYQSFYNISYKYQYKSSDKGYNYSTTTAAGESTMDGYVGTDIEDPTQDRGPTKAFVPATEFNPDNPKPFGRTLDPPAG
jgi:hypothetical protein